MSDRIFAEGFYFNRNENAPDFVIGRIGIDVQRFIAWLEKQPVSDRGYLNISVTRSKDGTKYSAALDTWKPNSEKPKQSSASDYRAARDGERRATVDFDDQIPFMTHERGWLL